MKVILQTNRKLVFATAFLALFFGLTTCEDSKKPETEPGPEVTNFDAVASVASQFGPAVTAGQTLVAGNMTTNTPLIPTDIYRPSGAQGPAHQDLATFAWLEFISLASVQGAVRGETGGSFLNSGISPTANLVWESYQHRSELFPYIAGNSAGRAPDPWDQTPAYKMKNAAGDAMVNFNGLANFNLLDEATQIGMNSLYFPKNNTTMNPNGDYQVLFEAKVNQKEWDFENNNYTKWPDGSAFDTNFPNGIDLEDGTIEVKATWRPLASIAANEQYRYHQSNAIYFKGTDDNPIATTGDFALIGLHIIHKTPNFPTFVFATFEHQDNLTTPGGDPTGLYYVPTYNNITYEIDGTTTYKYPYPNSTMIPDPAYPDGWASAPYAEPTAGNKIDLPIGPVSSIPGSQPVTGGTGVPVTQPATTNSAVATVNQQALALMQQVSNNNPNFVWQYYFLKGVQGVPSNTETDPDYYLANIVTESSQPGIQLFTGSQGISSGTLNIPRSNVNVHDVMQGGNYFNQGGCQGCHGIAQNKNGFDFSFLYFAKTGGFNPDVTGGVDAQAIAFRRAKYQVMLNPRN